MNFRIFTPTRSGLRGATIRIAALAAACILSAAVASAQGTAAPGAAVSGKVGVISIRQAIAGTAEGKQAGAELQSQFAPRQNELEGMNKQISDVRQRLDAGQGKLDLIARKQRPLDAVPEDEAEPATPPSDFSSSDH